ncbi:MAG: sugar phosphate isomerase/epimerase, partial [Chloroflexota bacterium]|nr:sugar phosphate isomerase/epimerase [Chloroflexota bacterium]
KHGEVVAAGAGECRFPELLRQMQTDGYDGVFALEPHLKIAGPFRGFSGPDLFRHASQAFQRLLQAEGWAYQ